jgi:muramoyltetrapeptide carboxypeptidase
MLTRPSHLNPGNTIAIVAPASPPPDPKSLDRGVAVLEGLGFRVQLARHARRRHGFLAGSDRERAGDLMKCFLDSKVRAILCVRGGYGSGRLLPLLDYEAIRRHPKIFIGYSDITALHCALRSKAGLVTFHGPMAGADFAEPGLPDFTVQSFLRTVSQPDAPGSICHGYDGGTVKVLRPGQASGLLVGGNLSLICASLGTPYEPPLRKNILCFEDTGEAPYRIDRMLTQLLQAGLLQQVVGVGVGIHRNCQDPKAATAGEYRQSLEDVLRERLFPLKVPVVIGLPFGHVCCNATLPLGARATLDGDSGDLRITQAAVL